MIGQIYVCMRVDYKLILSERSRNVGVETLSYTESLDDGTHFIETVASRDAFGRSWNYDVDGDPFYDPEDEDTPEPPNTRFLVWDMDEVDDTAVDRPTSVVASISMYSSKEEDPNRSVIRSYKLCKTQPSVDSFLKATTEGDLELVRQVTSGESIFK